MTIDAATHRSLAVEANNSTWEYLEKTPAELTADEAEEMTRRAYAAAYHWARAHGATPANSARADWLLAKVWVWRGQGLLALDHARRCLDTCESAGLVDFDLAYAHEAMARSLACLGRTDEGRTHRDRAGEVQVAEADDRKQVMQDLANGPWFGMNES